jgi:Transposase IS116/IS110/IS902 family/Transposase
LHPSNDSLCNGGRGGTCQTESSRGRLCAAPGHVARLSAVATAHAATVRSLVTAADRYLAPLTLCQESGWHPLPVGNEVGVAAAQEVSVLRSEVCASGTPYRWFAYLLGLLADHGDSAEDQVPVAIETPRGLLTACLRATGRSIYPINPMSVARYRDRHSVAGRKSDHGDAVVLANVLRTDAPRAPAAARRHRTRPGHRGAGPRPARRRLGPHRRAQQAPFPPARVLPRLPGRLQQRQGPDHPARGSGHPGRRRRAHLTQLKALLKRGGRHRGIDAEAARLRQGFRAPQMRQLPLVEQAMGRQTLALLGQLNAACAGADDLEQATIESFNQHPDAEIITSFPGLGPLTGARVLAEIGDDRSRFADTKGLKAYAGAAPITRASGKPTAVLHRRVKNQRLARPATSGRSPPSPPHPAREITTTGAKTTGTGTPPPSATCSAGCSAACATAWPPASTTTKTQPSQHPAQTHAPPQLDN